MLGNVAVAVGVRQSAQPTATGTGMTWPYFAKRPLLIQAGTGPVSVSIPASWRDRAALTWGSAGQVETLTLTTCDRPAGVWDAYAGGLYLRSLDACVPVMFRLKNQTTTVTFGAGRQCA